MTTRVDVQYASTDESVPDAETITAWVSRAVAAAGGEPDVEVSLRVVGAAEMQTLNRDFRSQDKPTNVLSFPAVIIDGLPEDADVPLGDIVVCSDVVRDEAGRQGKSVADHWAHMIVHGTLHLLGFDHIEDSEAAEMDGNTGRPRGYEPLWRVSARDLIQFESYERKTPKYQRFRCTRSGCARAASDQG